MMMKVKDILTAWKKVMSQQAILQKLVKVKLLIRIVRLQKLMFLVRSSGMIGMRMTITILNQDLLK